MKGLSKGHLAAVMGLIALLHGVPCMVSAHAASEEKAAKPERTAKYAADYFFGKRLASVKLTVPQREKMLAIYSAHNDALEAAIDRHIEQRRRLRMLVNDPSSREEEIRSTAIEIGLVEGDLAVERNRILKEVVNLLTPEQAAAIKRGSASSRQGESIRSR